MNKRVFVFGFFLLPILAWTQSFTASVRGTVTDPTQASVPDAVVMLTDVDRNLDRTATTDATGRFILTALPPGHYSLAVESPGFQRYVQPAFSLEVQQQATINVELTLGEVTTTIEVSGRAELLNTATATMGQVIENKFILNAPLAGRNPLGLVTLTPGVVPTEGEAGGVESQMSDASYSMTRRQWLAAGGLAAGAASLGQSLTAAPP